MPVGTRRTRSSSSGIESSQPSKKRKVATPGPTSEGSQVDNEVSTNLGSQQSNSNTGLQQSMPEDECENGVQVSDEHNATV